MNRLQILMAVHAHFVDGAKLPSEARPSAVQNYLADIQKQIMEELDKLNPNKTRIAA